MFIQFSYTSTVVLGWLLDVFHTVRTRGHSIHPNSVVLVYPGVSKEDLPEAWLEDLPPLHETHQSGTRPPRCEDRALVATQGSQASAPEPELDGAIGLDGTQTMTARTDTKRCLNSLLELKECPKTTCWKVLM